jgi:beta-hydroxylase
MFALLPGGSHLNPHRDPFGGSLRYHLGLSTPNSFFSQVIAIHVSRWL